jgi:hypothetical protein
MASGFTGGYTVVKDDMRERDRRGREMFVPLAHPPGHAQADFGEATAIIGGVAQKAHVFVMAPRTATPALCGPIRRRLRGRAAPARAQRAQHDAERLCRLRGRHRDPPLHRGARRREAGMTPHVALAFADWPAADQALREALVARGSALDEAGPFAHLRDRSQVILREVCARWHGWLAQAEPEALAEPPVALAGMERLLRRVEALRHLAAMSRGA